MPSTRSFPWRLTDTVKKLTTTENNHICRPPYKDSFLKWAEWSGSLPEWAVKVIYHQSTQVDYICAPRTWSCWKNTGFYNPSKGPFCFYPCEWKAEKASEFDILVNEHNLEMLKWEAYRDDIKNAVSSFNGICKVYAGLSKYGIGSVFKIPQESFHFYPSLSGKLYTENIEFLTVETGQSKVRIYNIEYHINNLAMLSQQPNVLSQMRVVNHNCRDIEQEVNLETSTERQSSWEMSISDSLTLSASIEVTVPFVSASAGVEYSNSQTVTNGNSLTETISNSLTVKVTVPPNHSCVVKMAGKKNKFDIPYKAQLSREFPNGRVHTTTVSGTYKGVQVGEMHAVAERCVPLPNAKPCPA